MSIRIAFVGKAGRGKTTAADHLIKERGFVRVSFAAKLKEIAKDLWPKEFESGVKPRKLLQDFGTKVREIDDTTWVDYAMRQVQANPNLNYVVDDLRYLNEARALKRNHFVIVRIQGPSRIAMPPGTEKHASEVEQDEIEADYTVANDNGIDAFNAKVDKLLEKIRRDADEQKNGG